MGWGSRSYLAYISLLVAGNCSGKWPEERKSFHKIKSTKDCLAWGGPTHTTTIVQYNGNLLAYTSKL